MPGPPRRANPRRGSGAGGAPTAALLAEAGFDVLVIEEGDHVRQGDVVPFSLEQMDRQYRSGGVTVALGLPSIASSASAKRPTGGEIDDGRRMGFRIVAIRTRIDQVRSIRPGDPGASTVR